MDEYGYLLNNLSSSVKRYSSPPLSSITQQDKAPLIVLVGCIILFIVLSAYYLKA